MLKNEHIRSTPYRFYLHLYEVLHVFTLGKTDKKSRENNPRNHALSFSNDMFAIEMKHR